MRRSYALRLGAAFAGIGIVAAALTAILVNVSFGTRFTSYLQEQQRARQQQLMTGLVDSYRSSDGWDVADLRSLQFLALMDGGTVRLLDAQGHTVWDAAEGVSPQAAAIHRQMLGSGRLGPERRFSVHVDGETVGTAIVRLPEAGGLPQDVSFRSSVNRLLLLGGILAGVAALVVGLVLAHRATAPAREITGAARALAAGDRTERVAFEGADEFGEMARAFNSMADTIEQQDRVRRAFAADVAHELRTPLAILRTQMEGIQDGVIEPSSPTLASLLEETLRLSRLVADLETLASVDAAVFSLDRKPVAVGPLLTGVATEFAGPFEAGEVMLRTDLADADAEADPTRIRQVATNLLSNALKFTPPGGEVLLSLRAEGDRAVIRVSDTGPGIPDDEIAHVFDRFFRGRSARAGGSGIGLTIARELVRAHGGEIHASSTTGEGTAFTVWLPMASPSEHASFAAPPRRPANVGPEGRR